MSDLADHRPYAIVPCDKGTANYRVKRYRERAEELRTIVGDLVHRDCHDMLTPLANSYDTMADREEYPRY